MRWPQRSETPVFSPAGRGGDVADAEGPLKIDRTAPTTVSFGASAGEALRDKVFWKLASPSRSSARHQRLHDPRRRLLSDRVVHDRRRRRDDLFLAFTIGTALGPLSMGVAFRSTGAYGGALIGFMIGPVSACASVLRLGPYRIAPTGRRWTPPPNRLGVRSAAWP